MSSPFLVLKGKEDQDKGVEKLILKFFNTSTKLDIYSSQMPLAEKSHNRLP